MYMNGFDQILASVSTQEKAQANALGLTRAATVNL